MKPVLTCGRGGRAETARVDEERKDRVSSTRAAEKVIGADAGQRTSHSLRGFEVAYRALNFGVRCQVEYAAGGVGR
jgi:hypothetical protein